MVMDEDAELIEELRSSPLATSLSQRAADRIEELLEEVDFGHRSAKLTSATSQGLEGGDHHPVTGR